jgi:hypothetical protein
MLFSQIRQATPARVLRLKEQQHQLLLRQSVCSSVFRVWVVVFLIFLLIFSVCVAFHCSQVMATRLACVNEGLVPSIIWTEEERDGLTKFLARGLGDGQDRSNSNYYSRLASLATNTNDFKMFVGASHVHTQSYSGLTNRVTVEELSNGFINGCRHAPVPPLVQRFRS